MTSKAGECIEGQIEAILSGHSLSHNHIKGSVNPPEVTSSTAPTCFISLVYKLVSGMPHRVRFLKFHVADQPPLQKQNLYVMYILEVAHYSHPLLKGAKHWSFITYEIKEPEVVQVVKSQSYMGKVKVGDIADDQRQKFEEIVLAIPVTRGSTAWNCQNWIVEALRVLKENGFAVEGYSVKELQDLLAVAKK